MKDKFNNAVGPQIRDKKVSTNKVIPILAILSLLAGLSASTQYFASKFNYHESLGGKYRCAYRCITTWTFYGDNIINVTVIISCW